MGRGRDTDGILDRADGLVGSWVVLELVSVLCYYLSFCVCLKTPIIKSEEKRGLNKIINLKRQS